MDNLLFECKIAYTKENSKEYVKLFFKKRTDALLVALVGSAVITAGGTLYAVFEEFYTMLICGLAFLLLSALLLINLFVQAKVTQKLLYKQCLERNNGETVENTIQFLENKFVATNPLTDNKNDWSYTVIKQVKESDNLIALITKAKQIIIVDKRTFSTGTVMDFRLFVQSKVTARRK